METHFRHKRTSTSNSFGVVVSTVAQHSFKVLGGGSNPSGPTNNQVAYMDHQEIQPRV